MKKLNEMTNSELIETFPDLPDGHSWDELKAEAIRRMATGAELESLRAKLNGECETCFGSGVMRVLVNVLPPDEREVYEDCECGECHGQGRGWIGDLVDEIERQRTVIVDLFQELAEAKAACKCKEAHADAV